MPGRLTAAWQAGDQADLADEPLWAERRGELAMEHLKGHGTVVLQIPGEEDRGHATTAEHQLRYPSASALKTARVRSRTSSLVKMLEVWFFTVPSAIPSALAISRLL
jgi:hypothetical protein